MSLKDILWLTSTSKICVVFMQERYIQARKIYSSKKDNIQARKIYSSKKDNVHARKIISMQERSFACKKDHLHARKIICMQELLFYMTYVRNDEPMSKLDFVC